jgi:hypothetical protein
MGWWDRIVGVFRGRAAEQELAEEPKASVVAPDPAPAPALPRPQKVLKAPKPKKERAPKPAVEKRSKKQRRPAPVQAAPERPQAEVLSVEEAERRYGAEVRRAAEPRREVVVQPPAPVIHEPAAPPMVVAPEPPRRRERARAPAVAFRRLLSRADALLAVDGARLHDLEQARRELAEGWRRLGPPDEDGEPLVAGRDERFSAFDARIAVLRVAEEAELAARRAAKQAVVERATALAEGELKGAGPAMGALRQTLRGLPSCGPDDAALQAAFAAAEARLSERLRAVKTEREGARAAALARLEQLVAQAEALSTLADAESAAQRAIGLQATWKAVKVPGGAPDALWARFRAASDAVFAARSQARAASAASALAQLAAVVEEAEQLADEGVADADRAIDALLGRWKKAGRAPRDAQQPLWERLQAAFGRIRNPVVDVPDQDPATLSFRPFAGLQGDER